MNELPRSRVSVLLRRYAPHLFFVVALVVTSVGLWKISRNASRPARTGVYDGSKLQFATKDVTYTFSLSTGLMHVTYAGGQASRDLALSLVSESEARPLMTHGHEPIIDGNRVRVGLVTDNEAAETDLALELAFSPLTGVLQFELLGTDADKRELRIEATLEGAQPFLSGFGVIGEPGAVEGHILSLEQSRWREAAPSPTASPEPAAYALVLASKDALQNERIFPEPSEGTGDRIVVTTRAAGPPHLSLLAGKLTGAIWESAFHATGDETVTVRGQVTGLPGVATVVALGDEGQPVLRVNTAPGGAFSLPATRAIREWYATLDNSRTSESVRFDFDHPKDLRLDISPGGTLSVRVLDGDTKEPLTARLIVRGIGGSVDPNFGPDFRATGAGPIVDTLRGEFTTPIPAGKYRVLASRGIEYSIDMTEVEIPSGRSATVTLSPRRVVPTPGWVGCDLHVHARPSFDSPVSAEDRVLSLVAAGVEFAVPTEHNIVGSYDAALRGTGLRLSSVPGVEVTTFSPRFGHFGVFPYPVDAQVPPFRKTTPGSIFTFSRRDGDPNRIVQVNHPRMGKQIGYFDVMHLDPKSGRREGRTRMDFDAIEVLNGFELTDPKIPERNLVDYLGLLAQGRRYVGTGSSDSHRILFGWAGYPRTYVHLDPGAAVASETSLPDPLSVVKALKRGRATASAGPILEVSVLGAGPGEEAVVEGGEVSAHVVVRAAPWIDVTSVEVFLGGKHLRDFPVTRRELSVGPEVGSIEEVQARTVRFDQMVALPPIEKDTFVVVVARGDKTLETYLPATPIKPIAFSNPVWLTRRR
ncbi:MAG: CehA/McbA family metallohydrolase [Polyangiaceae bacterium]